MSTATVRGAIRGMDHRANPAFAVGVVAVPAVALAYALTLAPVVTTATVAFVSHRTPDRTASCDQVCEQSQTLLYVHVMAGVLRTGIDLFMALASGPSSAACKASFGWPSSS